MTRVLLALALAACTVEADPDAEVRCPEPGEPMRCPDGFAFSEYGEDPTASTGLYYVCLDGWSIPHRSLRCEAYCPSGALDQPSDGELLCAP